jgi:hypothetical protein
MHGTPLLSMTAFGHRNLKVGVLATHAQLVIDQHAVKLTVLKLKVNNGPAHFVIGGCKF